MFIRSFSTTMLLPQADHSNLDAEAWGNAVRKAYGGAIAAPLAKLKIFCAVSDRKHNNVRELSVSGVGSHL
jgi:hypothetical protein